MRNNGIKKRKNVSGGRKAFFLTKLYHIKEVKDEEI